MGRVRPGRGDLVDPRRTHENAPSAQGAVARRKDTSTVQNVTEGILRLENSTNYASFNRFHIEQAIKFHDRLNAEISKIY